MLSTLKVKQEIQCEDTWECMDFVYICIVVYGSESGEISSKSSISPEKEIRKILQGGWTIFIDIYQRKCWTRQHGS